MPKRIGKLSDLQTLSLFIVSKENRINELQGLNLRGELNIKSLQNVLNPFDAQKVGLRERQTLHSLGLSWDDVHNSNTIENDNYERVIERHAPRYAKSREVVK